MINLLILITKSLDNQWIWLGENWCWTPLGLKGIRRSLQYVCVPLVPLCRSKAILIFKLIVWLLARAEIAYNSVSSLPEGPFAELPFFANWGGVLYGLPGWFPFNKNSSLKFRKFHDCQWIARFTDLTQATAHSFIVLVIRIQKSITGDNNLFYFVEINGKGTFPLKCPPFKVVPKVKNKWSFLFDF